MKLMKALVVMALVVLMAAPAFAELSLNGYYRVQGTAQDLSKSLDGETTTFVDQRFRMKLTNKLNDSVKLVYYGEVDTPWGEPSKGSIGGGGQQGADAVNLETKNAYLNFVTSGWDFTVGIQNMGDNAADIVIDNDVAGITAKTKLGGADLTLRYAKLYENGSRNTWNDEDFYAVQTSFTLSDTARVGFDVLYFDDNAEYKAAKAASLGTLVPDPDDPTVTIYKPGFSDTKASGGEEEQLYVSVDGDFNFGDANVTGFFLYGSQDAEGNPAVSTDDLDGDNWAASAQYATKLGNGNFSVRGIYFADADKKEDVLFTDDHGTGFQFYKEGLMLFLTDIYYNNGSQGALFLDAIKGGHGLSALTLKGNVGLDSGYYLKYAAGYFMANDDTSATGTKVGGESMGTEFDLMFGKKVNEKVDLSIRGAYAFLGDFYDTAAGDPENPWKAVAMINVGF